MTEAEKLKREIDAQQVVNAYHRTFETSDGKRVLADISKVFGTHMPTFLPKPDGGYDPLHAAKRDGQQDVVKHINARLAADPKGDSQVKSRKRKVIK
jgi:hypothetical protein